MTPVFQILDQFEIEKGLVLTGSPMPHAEDHKLEEGANVEIRSAGRTVLSSKVAGFELMRNCWSPHGPRPMAVLLKAERLDSIEGAELWIDEAGLVTSDAS